MQPEERDQPFPRPSPPTHSSAAGGPDRARSGLRQGRGAERADQVGSLLARALQERLARGLNDPRVQGMVSILGVDVTPDLASALVRISVFPADRGRLTLSGIRSAARHLESGLREATLLRSIPRLRFELDESIQRESRLLETLANLPPNERAAAEPVAPPVPQPPPTTPAEGTSPLP